MIDLAIYSGSRSEYGIWWFLIGELLESNNFRLYLYIGQNLKLDKSELIRLETLQKKFPRFHVIYNNSTRKVNGFVPGIISAELENFNNFLKSSKPHYLLILGDRYELFAPVLTAYYSKVPIIHLHGGEKTVGSLDDSARHAITKLCNVHCTASEVYSKRLIQLGEDPAFIFNIGSISIDRLHHEIMTTAVEVEPLVLPKPENGYCLLAYNPVTNASLDENINNIHQIFDAITATPELNFVITAANEDIHALEINREFASFADNSDNSIFVGTLGFTKYYTVLLDAVALIGNSSSGVIDAPFLKKPSINLGNRQMGRLMAPSVISVPFSTRKILEAIKFILNEDFQYLSYYGAEGASSKLIDLLMMLEYPPNLVKNFRDA